jgi:hypothetical protein
MTVSVRPFLSLLILVCLLACTTLPAGANSVSVSGSAYEGNDSNGMSAIAGILSLDSAAPVGLSNLGGGTAGVPMTLSVLVLPWSGPSNAAINVGSQFTDILQGAGILFTGTFTVPLSAIAAGTFTTPVSVMGQLSAYKDLTLGQGFITPGPLMANLNFKGTGVATFDLIDIGGGQFVILDAGFTFTGKGTLTAAPEPGSFLLIATGLALMTLGAAPRLRSARSRTAETGVG